jgi:hypothetical protein
MNEWNEIKYAFTVIANIFYTAVGFSYDVLENYAVLITTAYLIG